MEVIGGLLLIAGFYTRWIVIALLPILLVATLKVHASNGWLFTSPNGGWEFPAFLTMAMIVQFLLGDGAYALSTLKPHRRSAGFAIEQQFRQTLEYALKNALVIQSPRQHECSLNLQNHLFRSIACYFRS
jgi:hypothetical protein